MLSRNNQAPFLVLLVGLLLPGLAFAGPAERLAGLLEGYHTYQADFTQTLVDDTGSQVQQVSGELKAKRPGLFYWRTQPPFTQVIVADGEVVKVYDPDLLQLTLYPMEQKLSATPALLLSGNVAGLSESFAIREEPAQAGDVRFVLKPRSPDSLFLSLALEFRDGRLIRMQMHDSLDQRSTLVFDHIVINGTVPASVFSLEVPEDVDVVSNLESG